MNLCYLVRTDPNSVEKTIDKLATTGVFIEGKGWEYPDVKVCFFVDVAIRKEFVQGYVEQFQGLEFNVAFTDADLKRHFFKFLESLFFTVVGFAGIKKIPKNPKRVRTDEFQLWPVCMKDDKTDKGVEIR